MPIEERRWSCHIDVYNKRAEEDSGLCLACGSWSVETPPMARRAPCRVCECDAVYGLPVAVQLGRLVLVENHEVIPEVARPKTTSTEKSVY